MAKQRKTVFDFLADPNTPELFREFLQWFLQPVVTRNTLKLKLGKHNPILYADYKGERVRCVMASRLNDIGITKKLEDVCGYDLRVDPNELSNFGTEQ
jgi:hypothetical protein